jgi:hypothetical protein
MASCSSTSSLASSSNRLSYHCSTSIHAPAQPNPTVSIDPITWKDTAFDLEKRDELGFRGLLPPVRQSLEVQVTRTLHQLRSKKAS